MPREADPGRLVSIVLAIRDEQETIEPVLAALRAQRPPEHELELIVAVAPSSDRTEEIVRAVAADDPRIRVIANPEGTAPSGLNRALRHASGELIARVDGHTHVDADFLATALEVLEDTGASGAGGRVLYRGRGPVGRAIAVAMGSRLGGGGAAFRTADRQTPADTLMFGLYPRSVFDRVGGFDESLIRNQDDEWHHRARLAGERFVVDPRIRFEHRVRAGYRGVWRQHAEWGAYRVATLRKHRAFGAARQAAAPLLVAGIAVAAVAELAGTRLRTATRAGALVYAGVVTVGGAREASNAGLPRGGPLVSAAIAVMHIAYGGGFWRELLAPRLR